MKHRLLTIILAASIAATLALPVCAQSVSGYLDVVDQQSVLGWACYAGDPNTKLSVELWAIDAATGYWVSIGTTTADKQRNDVGAAGVCGSGAESYYHGFEWPIYPNNILNKNANYSIYAFYRSTGQFLGGSGRAVGFPESGLPTSSYWRTDFDDPNNRAPALISCIWPYLGANARAYQASDPLWINPGAGPTWPSGLGNTPLGYTSPTTWCINYDPLSNPLPWSQSNSATNAPSWPMSNYWVVSANYEPSYSQLNSGPPDQSQPLNGGLYSLSTDGSNFMLGVDNSRKPTNPDGSLRLDGIPFLSVGAQMGRGSAGPLAVFDPGNSEVYLQFSATKNLEVVNSTRNYRSMSVYIEAMWAGQKRMVNVTLQQQATARVHWNWNLFPSFFYPGAEIDLLSIDDLGSRCNIYPGTKMDLLPAGATQSYNIPIGAVFRCADNTLGWSDSRPPWIPLFVTGVHLAIELPDGDQVNKLNVTYSKPRLVTQ